VPEANNDDVFKLFDLEDVDAPQPEPKWPEVEDTAKSWSDITGSTKLVEVMKAFVLFSKPRRHILVYGSNRSGKTFTIHTALKAKFCRKRLPAR
jgi:hypothetical protein